MNDNEKMVSAVAVVNAPGLAGDKPACRVSCCIIANNSAFFSSASLRFSASAATPTFLRLSSASLSLSSAPLHFSASSAAKASAFNLLPSPRLYTSSIFEMVGLEINKVFHIDQNTHCSIVFLNVGNYFNTEFLYLLQIVGIEVPAEYFQPKHPSSGICRSEGLSGRIDHIGGLDNSAGKPIALCFQRPIDLLRIGYVLHDQGQVAKEETFLEVVNCEQLADFGRHAPWCLVCKYDVAHMLSIMQDWNSNF